MAPNFLRACLLGLVGVATVLASKSCPGLTVSHDGAPAGTFKNVSGIQIYHTYPPKAKLNASTAILYITDIFGVPLAQNKLLADSLARAGYTVLVPDLFHGDAVPANALEAGGPGFDFPGWLARHPVSESDAVVAKTIAYMRGELGVKNLGAVGYCWGGKYVPRFLKGGNEGVDVGFIAHPTNLEDGEIRGVAGPISIAAGDIDDAFNASRRHTAEDILMTKNVTYQTTLYAGAPHGFGVRVDMSNKRQKFAKEGAFYQAVGWFDAWL